MTPAPALTVHNLTKIYGSRCQDCIENTGPDHGRNVCPVCGSVVACADITFEVMPGEILGIVGESGSGKSTIVRCLHFDMEPTGGCAYLRCSYYERTLRSVANLTRHDAEELLKLAGEIPLHTDVEIYPLAEANEVLKRLKRSEIKGAAVLEM